LAQKPTITQTPPMRLKPYNFNDSLPQVASYSNISRICSNLTLEEAIAVLIDDYRALIRM
jgi:hypothetical protein